MNPYMKKCTECGDYGWAVEARKESDFHYKKHERKDGSFRINFDGKCKPCRRAYNRDQQRGKLEISPGCKNKHADMPNDGPVGVYKLYFCQISAPDIERISRYGLSV